MDKKDRDYYPYHHKKGHALDQCVIFRRIFDKKLQDEEIILQRRHLESMSGSSLTIAIIEAKYRQWWCSPQNEVQKKTRPCNLRRARPRQDGLKGAKSIQVRTFCDQMDLNPKQMLAITNSIIELIDLSKNSDLVESKSRRSNRFRRRLSRVLRQRATRPLKYSTLALVCH